MMPHIMQLIVVIKHHISKKWPSIVIDNIQNRVYGRAEDLFLGGPTT